MAECTHKSKENLTAASVPKYEKYKGNDNAPVINKIVLLAFTKVRKPINAIFRFPAFAPSILLARGQRKSLRAVVQNRQITRVFVVIAHC